MPETGYIVAVLAIAFVITLTLRALPFAVLKPLRESELVAAMAAWMPVGILALLAAATFRDSAAGHLLEALTAAAVTVAVHLSCGRRTLLSIAAGTATFVLLVNLL
ncbi:branched-chain amino acid transporter permease [Microbacterium sp. gxy059]|uniref:branched-chain amino acid transporter permease n=1 Tax=Microbacterium sp. gxy059 TaxID=2957199 RepID=UPI003D9743BA